MAPVRMAVSGVRGEPEGGGAAPVPRMAHALGYLIACGLIGDPVPPVITSGGAQKKNS